MPEFIENWKNVHRRDCKRDGEDEVRFEIKERGRTVVVECKSCGSNIGYMKEEAS